MRWFLSVLTIIAIWSWPAAAEHRVALVIGIGAYDELRPLKNPVNDASDVAAALTRAGYEVDLHTDIDSDALSAAIDAFVEKLNTSDTGFFYYAGHGMEIDGVNYLIPRNARSSKARWLAFDSAPLDDIFQDVAHTGKRALFFIDACRSDPFSDDAGDDGRGARPIGGVINPENGFNKVTEDKLFDMVGEAPSGSSGRPEFLVTMSTGAGRTAEDGVGRNSPFAATVIEGLAQQRLTLLGLLDSIRDRVNAASGGRQQPYFALIGLTNISLWAAGQ